MFRSGRAGICLAALFVLCAPASARDAHELIVDTHFRRGFKLLDPKPGKLVWRGVLRWETPAGEPVWRLAQWSSRHTLEGAKAERLASGAVRFANVAKAVVVGPTGAEDGDIVMAVNGRAEYGSRARRKGEPWPHLLVSQRFRSPPAVAELTKVLLNVAVRLRASAFTKTADYSPLRHAAQFAIFLTVQNLNRQSKGYGDFLYFGVPLYDSRWRVPRTFQQPDSYRKFIYTPPGEVYTSESVHDGRWVTVHRDVLPLIHDALKTAWKRGFLQDSQDPADYRVSAMNMGWEVSGLFDVEMQVRDLSLIATTKERP